MAIQNPEKVAERQRRRHPKAFEDGDVLHAFREFQKAEMERTKVPIHRRRFRDPPVVALKR